MTIKNSNTQLGFTLIEALVVIFIIGVLAAIAIPSYLAFIREKAEYTKAVVTMGIIKTAMDEYRAENGDFPPDVLRNQRPEGIEEFPIFPENDTPADSLFDYDKEDDFARLVFLGTNGQKETPNSVVLGAIGEPIKFGDDLIINLYISP